MKFIGILGLELDMENLVSGKIKKHEYEEKALYKELPEAYKKANFGKVLAYMVNDEKGITAYETKTYLEQHNGHNLICEVKVYDENLKPKRNEDGSTILNLEEKVVNYIDRRIIKDSAKDVEYDCLFMTVNLYSDVGAK